MEEKNSLNEITAHLKDYAETKLSLARLEVSDKVSSTISSFASVMLLGLLGVFILLFISIGVAWWIGQQNGSPALGFFIVAAFYILIAALLYGLREKWIKLPVVNFLLKKLYEGEE